MTGSTLAAFSINPTIFLIFSAWHPFVLLLSSKIFVPLRFVIIFFTQKYPSLNLLPRLRHQVPPGSNPLPSGREQGEGSPPSRCFDFVLLFSPEGDGLTLHKGDYKFALTREASSLTKLVF